MIGTNTLTVLVGTANNGGLSIPERMQVATVSVAGTPTQVLLVASQGTSSVLEYSLLFNANDGKFLGTFIASGAGGLNTPTGFTFDPARNAFLLSSFGSNNVLAYDTTGAPVGNLNPPTLASPEDVALDPNNSALLMVSDGGSNDVLSYNINTFQFNSVFVTPGSGGLAKPQGLVFGPDGNLYVSSAGTNEVLRYDGNTGLFIDHFVPTGAGDLTTPQGVVFAPNGDLLVSSRDTNVVLAYDPNGIFIGPFTPRGLVTPIGLTFSNGSLYVASQDTNQVLQYSAANGMFIQQANSENLETPTAVLYVKASQLGALASQYPNGLIYVANQQNNEVLRFDGATGAFVDAFIYRGSGGLIGPQAMAISPLDHNLYVASTGPGGMGQVLKYNLITGAYLGIFVQAGSGGLTVPEGLAFDASGNLYVSSGSQVLRFKAAAGTPLPSAGNGGATFVPAGSLGGPAEGLIVDASGNLYVASGSGVFRFTSAGVADPAPGNTGAVFVKAGAGGLGAAQGLGFDSGGTLYVTDLANDQVIRYNGSTGSFIDVIVKPNRDGLFQPESIVFTPTGMLVASFGTNQILAYTTTTGEPLGNFTPGPLGQPQRIAFDAAGNMYVSSAATDAVLKYDTSGRLQTDFVAANYTIQLLPDAKGNLVKTAVPEGSQTLSKPDGLVFAADSTGALKLLVSSAGSDNVLRFDATTGLPQGDLVVAPPVDPGFETIGPDGLLYVSSPGTNSIVRYNPTTGALLGTFIAPLSGGLSKPQGLAFSADGRYLFVASSTFNPVTDPRGLLAKDPSQILRFDAKTGLFLDALVPSGGGNLLHAEGITVGPDGNLYVADYGTGTAASSKVLKFAITTGAYLGNYVSAGSGGLAGATGLAFDKTTGYLYVGSFATDSVLRYKPNTGAFDQVFVTPQSGGLDGPVDLAFDSAGNLLVVSGAVLPSFVDPQVAAGSLQDNRVLKYAAGTGAFVSAIVARGSGGLESADGLAVGADGSLYVSSRDTNQVIKYDPTGTFLAPLAPTAIYTGLAWGPDVNGDGRPDLFAADASDDRVVVLDGVTGEYVETFVQPRAGGLSNPSALRFGPDGTLYVSSFNNNEVLRYGLNGQFLNIAAQGHGLIGPDGLAFNGGNLFVVGQTSDNVLVFDANTGAFSKTLVATTAGLNAPKGIAYDALRGRIYVTDSLNDRVMAFDSLTGMPIGTAFNQAQAAAFTDPTTGKAQNDAFSNNVYIAWATNELGDTHSEKTDQVAAIVLTGSSDGASSFTPPEVLDDTKFLGPNGELDAAPKITISQGRLPNTNYAGDPGIPAGQVSVIWDEFGSQDFRIAPAFNYDTITTDHVQAGVSYSATSTYDVKDYHNAIVGQTELGTTPVTSSFPLSVNITDPRFTTVSHVDVRVSLALPDGLQNVEIDLVGPDGTRIPLIRNPALHPGETGIFANAGVGLGLGLLGPLDPNGNPYFTIDTVFDEEAPRSIDNAMYKTPFVGAFRPDTQLLDTKNNLAAGPDLTAFYGLGRASINGTWRLEITDFSGSKLTTPMQRLLDWGLDFSSNMTGGKDTIVDTTDVGGRLTGTVVKAVDLTGPYVISQSGALLGGYNLATFTGVDPGGIAPAPVIASDNTLGSFSPYQGRIYAAYVTRDTKDFSGALIYDNTDITLKYSDDGGATWSSPQIVNDDNAMTDGFSDSYTGQFDGVTVTYGRPQFKPAVAVDPTTGTLAVSFQDARNDPQRALVATYVGLSIDGGATFSPETFVNDPQVVTDGITGQPVTLGPIPDNESPAANQPWFGTPFKPPTGYGDFQGLALVGGHLYQAYAGNDNWGTSTFQPLNTRVTSAVIASGPRVVTSTMGPITPSVAPGTSTPTLGQTVHALDGTPVSYNNTRAVGVPGVADGTALVNGFVVQFDRPIDPGSLSAANISVTYRSVTTSGFAAGVNVPIASGPGAIIPLLEGNTAQGPTRFLIFFATPQGKTGTYSYEVGPSITDRIRSVTSTGTIVSGNQMDQNSDGTTGEDPRSSPFLGTSPGDIYADPTPTPLSPTTFSGTVFAPPFDRTTQPLIVPGPHVINTFVPGVLPTPDNLVTDQTVSRLAITFDRAMDTASLMSSGAVLRVMGPSGLISGPYMIAQDLDNSAPANTYYVSFPTQQLSGTYTVTLDPTKIRSSTGDYLDTNENAGLDMLRGDPSAGTVTVTYKTPNGYSPAIPGANSTTDSKLVVPDNFVVQNVTLTISVTYANDPALTGYLIAPDGTTVQLFSGVGATGTKANFNSTTFDDTATTPIQNGGPDFFGTFNPQFPLSVLKGRAAAGTWILRIVDSETGKTGTINNWTLNLGKPVPLTGLGESVADQFTGTFRIFVQNPTNPLASDTWTAVGPAGIGAQGEGLNAQVSGRVNAIAVDPSDPSGNTVYIGAASGGIWKTTDFLTTSPVGPTYVPLTDFGPTLGMNIGSIAIFGRNNDPNQSILFATTGDPNALGVEVPSTRADGAPTRGDTSSLSTRGIGILRSEDGGATWTLLDSATNVDAQGNLLPINSSLRKHDFSGLTDSTGKQVGFGTVGYKITVDPTPTTSGNVIVYAAMADVDVNGNAVSGTGISGGIWRSEDSGNTWTRMKAGQATDVILDQNSGTGAPNGNLQILYAAFQGDGVYSSPNQGQVFNLMTGALGDPLIRSFDSTPTQPVPVLSSASDFSKLATPNSISPATPKGKIVLAKPALTGNPLQDVLYEGWLYAAVISTPSQVTTDNQLVAGGHLDGVYVTKDFGQNWTRIQLSVDTLGDHNEPKVPTNNDTYDDYDPAGEETPYGEAPDIQDPADPNLDNFGLGNFDLALTVDPSNPNVLYLGGTDQYQTSGLLRIDTTGLADPHAFYVSNTDPEGTAPLAANLQTGGQRGQWENYPTLNSTTASGPVLISAPGAANAGNGTTSPFSPVYNPYLNLLVNPRSPFLTAATIPVTNLLAFSNSGAKATWTPFDQALQPSTFDTNAADPWSVPTRGIHQIISMKDPVTGKTRLIFGDDDGVFTAVDNGKGGLIGSLGSTTNLATDKGDIPIASGSRNGNLQTTQFFYGAAEPSNLAANASFLKGMFYGTTNGTGFPFANANVIQPGQAGYGDITWSTGNATYLGTGAGIAVVQTGPGSSQYGSVYRFEVPAETDNGVVSDFFQLDGNSRTNQLINANGGGQKDPNTGPIFDVTDPQWPFRMGFNFAVNPLTGEQVIMSSFNGSVYSTETDGKFWSLIGKPSALDGSNAQALAYGAPDPNGPAGLGNLDNFVYAGTTNGDLFVTFTGGGQNGDQWKNLSAGLDGSSIQQIVTNPTRGSHEAYAVTSKGVYHMVDSTAAGATWVNITGNLFNITEPFFGSAPSMMQLASRLKDFTSVQADWRYIIPDNPANPTGSSHPVLYVGGEGGVFRSLDGGQTWTIFPSADPNGTDQTPSPPGDGGGLPNALVTSLNLVLGPIDPTTGRPDISQGPDVLYATTYGRGAFTIRLAPIVFPTSIGLDPKNPPPGGSDTGLLNNDRKTNDPTPFIAGLSEQGAAFGSVVQIDLYDETDPSIQPPPKIGSGFTDAAGHFSVQVTTAFATDGVKTIGVQATDQSGTKGNITLFSFTLDTTPPGAPNTPTLDHNLPAPGGSDSGYDPNDNYTNVTSPYIDVTGIEPGALVMLFDSTMPGTPIATATGSGTVTIQDKRTLSGGSHTYFVEQEDVAGNISLPSPNLTILVDITPPSKPLNPPVLESASDTGSSNSDRITKNTAPFFDMVSTEASATVVLFRKLATDTNYTLAVATSVGSPTSSASRRLQDTQLALQNPPDGVYNYAFMEIDQAGNPGPFSDPLTVTIDTTPPLTPTTPDLEDASDTGPSNKDNVTSATAPVFDITPTETTGVLQLLRRPHVTSGKPPAYVVVNSAALTGSLKSVALTDITLASNVPIDGVYDYASQEMDLAGNTSSPSSALVVTIDTTAPASALSLVLDAKSDSGPSNTDEYTNAKAPFFDVVASESTVSVQLFRAPQSSNPVYVAVGTPITGSGMLQDPSAPANGVYIYSVQETDAAGNPGVLPGLVTTIVTFDNIAPGVPTIPDLTDATDTGASNTDNTTKSTLPAFAVTSTETTATVNLLRRVHGGTGAFQVVGTRVGTGNVIDTNLPTPTPDGVYDYEAQEIDLAGNPGTASSFLPVTIDTTPPVVPNNLGINPNDDTGTKGDGITSNQQPRITGKTEAGAALVLFDASNPSNVLATGTALADGTFSLQPTSPLNEGIYSLEVRATDLAGNASTSGAYQLDIDLTAPGTAPPPVLEAASDSGQFNNDDVTDVTNPIFDLTPTETGVTIKLYRKPQGAQDSAYQYIGQVVGAGSVQDPGPVINPNTTGTFVYSTIQVDAAGNAGSYGGTVAVFFDTQKPAAPPAPTLDQATDSGPLGDGITNFKNGRILDVTATEPTATVSLFRKLASSPDSTYVLVGSIVGGGTISDTTTQPDNKYAYASQQTDLAGNVGPLGPPLTVTIDTIPPILSQPTLVPADDSNIKGDYVTNVRTPRFTGTTEAGVFVDLIGDTGVLGSVISGSDGTYTVAPSTNLPDGTYNISVRATDLAGNSTTLAAPRPLVIDTQPPTIPTLTLLPKDDSGLVGDFTTNVRRPHLVGVTDPGIKVTLNYGSSSVSSVSLADGTYSLQPTLDLADGKYPVQVIATDSAGNTAASSQFTLIIATNAPTAPTISLLPADDTGVKGDNITSLVRPRFTGTAAAGTAVDLVNTLGTVFGTAVADSGGTYVVAPSVDLVSGVYNFQARARDGAGNVSLSPTLTMAVDSIPPGVPTLGILPADDTGVKGDGITSLRRPRLTGITKPYATVGLYDLGVHLVSAAVAGADGSYTLTPASNLPLGKDQFYLVATDVAGNVGPVTKVQPVTVIQAAGDYDGDGRTDYAVYDPSSATFYFGYTGGGGKAYTFGIPNGAGRSVSGDFDGDGKADIAVYDPRSATFYISLSGGGARVVPWGVPNPFGLPNHDDIPISGDFDGDGKTDIAVYDQTSARFFIQYSSGGANAFAFGVPGSNDLPVAGDFDGDGKTDVAVYDPPSARWYISYSAGGASTFLFGNPNGQGIPVAGDFDGDGKTDIAVFDPASVRYYISYSAGGANIFQYGVPNGADIPVVANYDGDSKTDVVVYDPVGAKFYASFSGGGAAITPFGTPDPANVFSHNFQPLPALLPSRGGVTTALKELATSASGSDFAPIAPATTRTLTPAPSTSTSTPTAGSALKFAFGHPDRPLPLVKQQTPAPRAAGAHARKLQQKAIRPRATAHDLALESLWKGPRDE